MIKLVKNLIDIRDLLPSKLAILDYHLVRNFRFFSIIDKNVRYALYKSLEFVR